jgi:hypothetical protein
MRLFVLGDSFTENLFENYDNQIIDGNHGVTNYLDKLKSKNIDDYVWWTDWLKNMGYDVYNFGKSGCDINDIIYQFGQIDSKFIESDRIIINLTNFNRFTWYFKEHGPSYININSTLDEIDGNLKTELINQCVIRNECFNRNDGYLRNDVCKFINYLLSVHSKYKPLVWSPFDENIGVIDKKYWVDFVVLKHKLLEHKIPINIKEETFNEINDHHLGRYGNYYWALMLDKIIKDVIFLPHTRKMVDDIILNNSLDFKSLPKLI